MSINEKYSHQVCWLWLAMSLGVGNPKIWEYVNQHKTIEETCRYIQSNSSITKHVVDVQTAKLLLVDTLKKGIGIVCYSDEEYPKALKDVHNPPCILFYRGDLNVLDSDRLLTVVGTRKPSEYTVKVTTTICENLVKEGFTLVSGMAVGVDAIANASCVRQSKPTVAVVACGIDYPYPKENVQLSHEIVSSGGLILTEQ